MTTAAYPPLTPADNTLDSRVRRASRRGHLVAFPTEDGRFCLLDPVSLSVVATLDAEGVFLFCGDAGHG